MPFVPCIESFRRYVSHFPTYFELTKKSNLPKHLSNYKNQTNSQLPRSLLDNFKSFITVPSIPDPYAAETSKKPITIDLNSPTATIPESSEERKLPNWLDYLPETYVIPRDQQEWSAAFQRHKQTGDNNFWIVKPSARARGKGIFLVDSEQALTDQLKTTEPEEEEGTQSTRWVACKYIHNPFLINGKKFDIRLYVFVRSFHPLLAYVYKKGLVRFCSSSYTLDPNKIKDTYIHLTNVAVQKNAGDYDPDSDKWQFDQLLDWLAEKKGVERVQQLLDEIQVVLATSLLSCQDKMVEEPRSFELYGYDILLDENLKPYLMEVNVSPSLGTTTAWDEDLKRKLVDDCLSLICPYKQDLDTKLSTIEILRTNFIGDFHPLYDEAVMDSDFAAKRKERRDKEAAEMRSKVSAKKTIISEPTAKNPSPPSPTPTPSVEIPAPSA